MKTGVAIQTSNYDRDNIVFLVLPMYIRARMPLMNLVWIIIDVMEFKS